jgi:HK97 family phage prohead protease
MIERRAAVEVRVAGRRLEGLAAPYNRPTRIAGFTEVVRPGAFRRSLAAGGDVLALMDHDAGKVLARTRNGSLLLTEDASGLRFSLQIPRTALGNDALAMAEDGLLGGASFGFRVPRGGDRIEGRTRELLDVDLVEISIVSAVPAYDGTSVAARARMSPGRRLAVLRRFLETV